jgi:ech hydrogenase subunit D
MTQEQTLELITVDQLLDKVRTLRDHGFRMVQISATRLPDRMELTYSFDLNSRLTNLRVHLPADEPRVPSISSIYGCVVLYENEIHDLFNVQVDGMAVDFHGHLYRTAVKYPFGSTKAPTVTPSPATGPATGASPAGSTPVVK